MIQRIDLQETCDFIAYERGQGVNRIWLAAFLCLRRIYDYELQKSIWFQWSLEIKQSFIVEGETVLIKSCNAVCEFLNLNMVR
jgi:hypothetical protein